MKLSGCQWDIVWEDRDANFACAEKLAEKSECADLIILPEMFSTGFSMNVEKVAESAPSQSESLLKKLARDHDSAVLGGLVREGRGEKGYNELIAYSPYGNELGSYRKNRTFRYTGEFDHYENGTEITVFEWNGWKISPLICYDLRFPELFRRGAAKGAELFVVIASWPDVRVEHWLALLRARAIENLAYVIGVNRCGKDPNYNYPGRSVIFDPWGEMIADAGKDEGIVEAEIDLEKVRAWRAEFPALMDLEVFE